jgi:hypothetical protein
MSDYPTHEAAHLYTTILKDVTAAMGEAGRMFPTPATEHVAAAPPDDVVVGLAARIDRLGDHPVATSLRQWVEVHTDFLAAMQALDELSRNGSTSPMDERPYVEALHEAIEEARVKKARLDELATEVSERLDDLVEAGLATEHRGPQPPPEFAVPM